MPHAYLRPDVVVEPLWNDWHAWPYLLPPITAGQVTANRQLPILESFVADPEAHERALRDPHSLGGPYVGLPASRVPDVREWTRHTRARLARHVDVASDWKALDRLLQQHATGHSLAALYAKVPPSLRGFVELVYDRRNVAAAKPFEALLYRELASEDLETFQLFRRGTARPFVFSTPRLATPGIVRARVPFRSKAVDVLAKARTRPVEVDALADELRIAPADRPAFTGLFTDDPPRTSARYAGPGVRVRYFGHACVLLETSETSVLVDPWIGYDEGEGTFDLRDVPEHVDLVLITHSHADHLVLETLLQLRHRIGQIAVPRSGWSMLDPSLALILRQAGFPSVVEVDAFEEIQLPGGGAVVPMPFLGEHADLAIRAKATYVVRLADRGFFFGADANNLEPAVYAHARRAIGSIDVVFIGMECEGAPLDWLYGEFLSSPVSPTDAMSRRLDGSDAAKAVSLVDALSPTTAAFVYALGAEPWLTWLSAVRYSDASVPIVESNRFIAACEERDLHAERLYGSAELVVDP